MLVEAPSLEVAKSFVADSRFGKAGMFTQSHVSHGTG